MLQSPFRFEAGFTSAEFETIGRLALRWAAIEHFVANCLKAMLGLSDEQAIVIVFPLGMEAKLARMNKLAKINPLNANASKGLIELTKVMKALQFVRNNTIHAIVMEGDHSFELRRDRRSLSKHEVLSTEELTNYAGRVVIFLRHALGDKDTVGGPPAWPTRPTIPAFLQCNRTERSAHGSQTRPWHHFEPRPALGDFITGTRMQPYGMALDGKATSCPAF